MPADPWTLAALDDDALFGLECEARANGWAHIVHMCRDERKRRNA